MKYIIVLNIFILGAIFGSFILAVVDRMKSGKDWVRGRSECEHCHHILQPVDLVPVLSWISCGGKCRYCKTRLSALYPMAEVGLGLAFIVSFLFWPQGFTDNVAIAQFIIWLCALVLMWGLFLYDMRWFILPNKLMYPLAAFGALWAIISMAVADGSILVGLTSNMLAVLVSAGFFYALYHISNGKWIGFGDVRLGIVIGLFTGTWILAWFTIFLASILGIIVSLPLLFNKKTNSPKLKLRIPFGPMLITALFLVVLFGQSMIDWYASTVLLL